MYSYFCSYHSQDDHMSGRNMSVVTLFGLMIIRVFYNLSLPPMPRQEHLNESMFISRSQTARA